MDIKQEQIEEIISAMPCPKNFKCYKSQLNTISEIKDIGTKTLFKCSEGNPQCCQSSFPFGHEHFCKCPLRIFMAKKLKK